MLGASTTNVSIVSGSSVRGEHYLGGTLTIKKNCTPSNSSLAWFLVHISSAPLPRLQKRRVCLASRLFLAQNYLSENAARRATK